MCTVRRIAHHKREFQAILSRPLFAAWRTSARASEGERTKDRRGGYPAMFLFFFFYRALLDGAQRRMAPPMGRDDQEGVAG